MILYRDPLSVMCWCFLIQKEEQQPYKVVKARPKKVCTVCSLWTDILLCALSVAGSVISGERDKCSGGVWSLAD